jgi:hypothetical protein
MNARLAMIVPFITLVLFVISDDRSLELFRTRLETATQMREILNTDSRPNCLLIDEIDGAPAVNSLKFRY